MKMTPTMATALELINSGKIQVNNKRISMPNYICQPKDVISIFSNGALRKFKVKDYVN